MGAVLALLFGLGRLQPFLDNPDIENINANGCDRVFHHGTPTVSKLMAEPMAATDAELIELIRRIGARGGPTERRFDDAKPQLDAPTPGRHRLSAVMSVSAVRA